MLITVVLLIVHCLFVGWMAQMASDARRRKMYSWTTFFVVMAILNGVVVLSHMAALDQMIG